MPERSLSTPTHVAACIALILTTILNVALSFLPMPPIWHLVVGLVIGFINAVIVVSFYMDMWVRPPVIWTVAVVSTFWLGILLVLTLSDYFTRGMIPFTPGH